MAIWRGSRGIVFEPDARFYKDTDSVYVQLTDKPYYRSVTDDDIRIIDLDSGGDIIGITFLAVDQFPIDVSDLREGEFIVRLLRQRDLGRYLTSPSNQRRHE